MNNYPSTGLKKSPEHIKKDPRKILFRKVFGGEQLPSYFFGKYAIERLSKSTKNQKHIPSCTAEAGSQNTQILEYKETGKIIEQSSQFLYTRVKEYEGNSDWGAYMETIPKILSSKGIATEKTMKSDYSLTLEQFIETSRIPKEADEEALIYKISKAYAFSDDWDSYKMAIYKSDSQSVFIGLDLSNEGWIGGEVRPPKDEKVLGHGLIGFGFDETFIYGKNSWGENWGLTLHFKKDSDDNYKLCEQGEAEISVPGCFKMKKEYEPHLYSGFSFVDLPNEIKEQTMLLKTIKIKDRPEIYVILNNKKYWVTPWKMYEEGLAGAKPLFAPFIEISEEEANSLPNSGVWVNFNQ